MHEAQTSGPSASGPLCVPCEQARRHVAAQISLGRLFDLCCFAHFAGSGVFRYLNLFGRQTIIHEAVLQRKMSGSLCLARILRESPCPCWHADIFFSFLLAKKTLV